MLFRSTTAGEPLLIEEEFHRRKLVITKNVKSVSNDIFAESGDYINEEDTTIGGHTFKKFTLWLWPIEISPIKMENKVLYYQVTMTILHNPNTWIRRLRNAGYYMKAVNRQVRFLPGGGAEDYYPMEPIRFTSTGAKADRPILLDGEGRPIQMVITGKTMDSTGNPLKTYDIQTPDEFGRAFTEEELEKTVRHFRTRELLNFTKNLPLK